MTLEWDPSPSEVAGYRVYVGAAPGVYHTTIDVPDGTRFVFTGAQLGGLYYFAVAARGAGGAVSAPSNEVSGVATTEIVRPIVEPPETFGPEPPPTFERLRSANTSCDDGCGPVAVVASGTGTITALAVASDGTLAAVEDSRRIVSFVPGERPQTAFETARHDITLASVAFAPDYARSRVVLVGETSVRADGSRELHVVRYRALGTLGEGATVVAGLPAPAGDLPVSAGADGSVFVAIPAADRVADRYAGHVLAFDRDGRTRQADGAAAPVIAAAGAAPVGMFWDEAQSQLWLASGERQALLLMDLSRDGGACGLGRLGGLCGSVPLPFRPRAVSFARVAGSTAAALLSEDGAVYTMARGVTTGAVDRVAIPVRGHVTALALTNTGALYVAVTEGGRWTLLRLRS